jgi:hypothetical protein
MPSPVNEMFRDGTQNSVQWARCSLIPEVEQHVALKAFMFDRNILKMTTTVVIGRRVYLYTKFRSVALAVEGHFNGKLRRLPFPLLGRYIVTVSSSSSR